MWERLEQHNTAKRRPFRGGDVCQRVTTSFGMIGSAVQTSEKSICGKVVVIRNQPLAEFQLRGLHVY